MRKESIPGNQNITGSPDFGERDRVVGDPGSGCNASDIYRQFNTAAFPPPSVGSVGLDSGQDYLCGCFYQQFDLALQREFRFGETRRLSFRLDAFNAFNQSHVTGPNTTMTLASTTDPTIQNLPFDSNGSLIAAAEDCRFRHGQRLSIGADATGVASIHLLKTSPRTVFFSRCPATGAGRPMRL